MMILSTLWSWDRWKNNLQKKIVSYKKMGLAHTLVQITKNLRADESATKVRFLSKGILNDPQKTNV